MIIVVGITGATGVIYGIRLLEILSSINNVETHLILTENGKRVIKLETGKEAGDIEKLADYAYRIDDLTARVSSGSFQTDGMIIAPCTIHTMSALANSYSDNLLLRSADVTLKEARRLVLLVRETPLHLGHIRNMERLCEMGAIIMPPVPAFYHQPKSIIDIVDHTIGKALDLFNIEHSVFKRWQGAAGTSPR